MRRIEMVYRAGVRLLRTTRRTNLQGVLKICSRGYYVGGDLVMIQGDEDAAGVS